MNFREEEITALRTQLESVLERVISYRENLSKRNDPRINEEKVKEVMNYHLNRYQRFEASYNEFAEQRNLREFALMDEFENYENKVEPAVARGRLSDLKRNLKAAFDVLEKIENKDLGAEKVVRLTSIKDSIQGELTDSHPVLSRNLQKAIDALEDGHPKPASITAAGVVEHVMDEMKAELQVGDWDEALGELEDRGMIDEDIDGRIHRALKESRNELSHDLETDPDVNKAIHTISGAVRLLEQVSSIRDIEIKV